MRTLFNDPFLPVAAIGFVVGLYWVYRKSAKYEKQLIEFRENLRTGDRCRVELPGKQIINCRVVTCELNNEFQVIDIDTKERHFVDYFQILMP